MMLITQPSSFDNNIGGHFKIFEYYSVYYNENNSSVKGPGGQIYSRSNSADFGARQQMRTRDDYYLNNGYNTGNNFTEDTTPGTTWALRGTRKNFFATEFSYSYVTGTGPVQQKYYRLTRGPYVDNPTVKRENSTFWWNPNFIRTEIPSETLYEDTLGPLSDFVIDRMGDASITPPNNYFVRAFITWDAYCLYGTRWMPGGYEGEGSYLKTSVIDWNSPTLAYVSNFIVFR